MSSSVPVGASAGKAKDSTGIALSAGMMLVTLGVVYGDIGTSPMYVMKAIVNGNGGINSVTEELILGALSLVIWTITLVTTIKYVVVAMRADNHGEGGYLCPLQPRTPRHTLAHRSRNDRRSSLARRWYPHPCRHGNHSNRRPSLDSTGL